MSTQLRIFIILGCLILYSIFFNMLKKNKVYIKYTFVWLFSIFIIFIFSLFPKLIEIFSKIIGIETPVNFIFFIGILVLGLIVFSLTIASSRNSVKMTRLIQEIAILEYEKMK